MSKVTSYSSTRYKLLQICNAHVPMCQWLGPFTHEFSCLSTSGRLPLPLSLDTHPMLLRQQSCHVNLLPRALRDHPAGAVLHRDIIM